jgi:hypothetical protein
MPKGRGFSAVFGDAYGQSGTFTVADVWGLIDGIHTNRLEGRGSGDKLLTILEGFMDKLESEFPDIETFW